MGLNINAFRDRKAFLMRSARKFDPAELAGCAVGMVLGFWATAGIYIIFWLQPTSPTRMWLFLALITLVGGIVGVLVGRAEANRIQVQEPSDVPKV